MVLIAPAGSLQSETAGRVVYDGTYLVGVAQTASLLPPRRDRLPTGLRFGSSICPDASWPNAD